MLRMTIKMIGSLGSSECWRKKKTVTAKFLGDIWKWNNHSLTNLKRKLKHFRQTRSTREISNNCYCCFEAAKPHGRFISFQAFLYIFINRRKGSGVYYEFTSLAWSCCVKMCSSKYWIQMEKFEPPCQKPPHQLMWISNSGTQGCRLICMQ